MAKKSTKSTEQIYHDISVRMAQIKQLLKQSSLSQYRYLVDDIADSMIELLEHIDAHKQK
jgi:hypothetical protein